MMTEGEIIAIIKKQVRFALAQTLGGYITSTTDSYLCSLKRFDADSEMSGIRQIKPYGFCSRAPENTPTIVHPINGDPSHLLSLNDFDEGNRPAVGDGETAIYGSSGQVIYTSGTDVIIGDYVQLTGTFLPFKRAAFHVDGSYELGALKTLSSNAIGDVFIGSPMATSPLVLGDILSAFCTTLISILTTALTAIETGPIAISTAPGNPAPTSPTVIAAMTTAISALTTAQNTYITAPLTNFLSLSNYTDKGI